MVVERAGESDPQSPVVAPAKGGPTVLRILLGSQLRRLRQDKNISREDAGYAIRASHAKISRLELGKVGFKERDVADLLTLYGVTDPAERAPLLQLARQANEPGWWHKYNDLLPPWFEVYVGLEEAAAIIRTYEIQFVPGLLQSRDYARAVIVLGHPRASKEEIERRIELRERRQQRLLGPDAPTLWAVVDEAAVRRPLGGAKVMRGQIEHLLKMTERPNIRLQVLPFARGGHAAAGGPFTFLRFGEPVLPDVVYLEQLTSALYLDKREDTDPYMEIMDRVSVQANSVAATKQFLRDLLDELG